MRKFTNHFQPLFYLLLFIFLVNGVNGQTPLKLTDFAVWGGSSSPSMYNSMQGVFIRDGAIIKGNLGSNHLIELKSTLQLTGNLYSANAILLNSDSKFTGNIFAAKKDPNFSGNVIFGSNKIQFIGNLTANGKIELRTGGGSSSTTVTGQVAVPAPSANNYSGPDPTGGIVNTITNPVFPAMPNNTPFDNKIGTNTISNTQTISPGVFGKLALSGNKTLTFNGPGNYIFNEVNNLLTNKFVFDFKGTPAGLINIFVIKDAFWGKLSVKTLNGNFPGRIYTEVHGDGSSNSGFSFEVLSPDVMPNGSYVWLGNVWTPNGGISVKNLQIPANATPHIIGALWSAKMVDIKENLVLTYQLPAVDLNFIDPYYPPPPSGKVDINNNIIGAELFSLTQNPSPITIIPDNEIFRFDGPGNVMIEVISKTPNDLTLQSQLVALGMYGIIPNGPHTYVITGYFPINSLTQLNNNSRISYVRPLYPPINNRGQVTTQGDSTMRSQNVRNRFGLDGSGVKIGVLSDSYDKKLKAQDDVNEGDLPGIKSIGPPPPPNENLEPVQVLVELPINGNDEGRAMLQIVHDVAPKSKLAFRTGFLSAGDFANGIIQLADPGLAGGRCDVLVDDITYITEPFLQDGRVAQAVDQVVGQGVTYFSSAGNFGNRSHEAVFNGVTNTAIIPTGKIHQFGATAADIYQTINLKPGSYTIVLQWSDDFHSLGSVSGDLSDLDLYLVGSSGFTLFGFNRSNLSGDPFEVCPFTVTEETNARIMVTRVAGTASVRFKYIIFRGNGTITNYQTNASTIVGHPNAAGAIAVGAMLYANIPPFTPIWPGVASFSSRGGTFTKVSNTFITRNKPELIAPNGVNTTVNLGGASFDDGDPYPNFFGTSASAPHAAAVAGLLIQGRKKYNLQPTVTPAEIRQQLQTSTGKFSYLPGNFSFEGGYGFVQADSAIQQIANGRPIISLLEPVVPGAQNGTVPFQVKINGKYLTASTVIYYNGEPVTTTVSADKTEASATIPAIPAGTDPPFQLYNPPKSISEIDGGLSEALHFFSSIIDVTIRADNKTRKYGQTNPAFTAQVLINGVPIERTKITLAELKLDGANLSYTNFATPTSNAGLYGIAPYRTTPLANNDTLLAQYGFTFVSGTLSVGKMPVRITPNNKIVKYGEDIGEITYTYQFDSLPATESALQNTASVLHKKFLADNALVVMNGLRSLTTVDNLSPDLTNMSMMASFQAIRNARKFVLQNRKLTPLVANIDPSLIGNQRFIVDVSSVSLQNYRLDSANSTMVPAFPNNHARAFLNIKALANGTAKAAVPNGQLQPMVNGQLMAMVNGQLQALVNGQLQALVNEVYVDAEDIIFQNGQLLALVNGDWLAISNGQLQALVNNESVTIELSVLNGQLQAVVNGQLMPLVNGQLQAVVNGQLLAVVNGQLQAVVNGQLMPLVNGQLLAMVNGQLQPLVNGQLLGLVNGQLMALVNGELQIVQNISLSNGQLQAIVNGQLQPLVNGQLQAMVNGTVLIIQNADVTLVNGQLQAVVNGQLQALVNGQLQAIVNGQLQPLVNGDAVDVTSVRQLANGQLQALVNGNYIPIANGQLQALVNGQLLAMVNGQLMAVVNGEVTFAVFQNGQLQALVNGQLQALVNGQLQAMVNGQLQVVNSYSIVNGQLQAVVNNQTWTYANGQLLALVNGQLQPLVNNFDINGSNNNSNTLVLVDQDDITLQAGGIGGMFAMNMITGLNVGNQKLVPGAFINSNFEVTYGLGEITITPSLLIAKTDSVEKVYGEPNPDFTTTYTGFAYNDNVTNIVAPTPVTNATTTSGVGNYPVTLTQGGAVNYTLLLQEGNLEIIKKPLFITAIDNTKFEGEPNPPFTLEFDGFINGDNGNTVCSANFAPAFQTPASPISINQLGRVSNYSNISLNGGPNVITVSPGGTVSLTGNRSSSIVGDGAGCPGCITQHYIGIRDVFSECYNANGSSGLINHTFKAPLIPGVYYITQVASWEYNCFDNGTGNPTNDSLNAIGVVIVEGMNKLYATTTASTDSAAGIYPIILDGCSDIANYEVRYTPGELLVQKDPCLVRHWDANRTYTDRINNKTGTVTGGVSNLGLGKVGGVSTWNGSYWQNNSFSLDGTGYIDMGTASSVSGTQNFSVSAWVQTTSNDPMVIINQRSMDINEVFGTGFNGEYILKIGGAHNDSLQNRVHAGKAYFLIYDNDNNPNVVDLFSTSLVNDGNWHQIKAERIGTRINLYVDGRLEATAFTPGVVNLNSSIGTYIGADYRDNASYYTGLIDEIKVSICVPLIQTYNRVEPQAEANLKIGNDKLYPNPASSLLRLELKTDVALINEIQVFDVVGKLFSTSVKRIGDGIYEINVSSLSKGLYLLKVKTTTGIKAFRFIKR